MLGNVFGFLGKVAKVGSVMAGAGIVVEGAKRAVNKFAPQYEPVLAGPLDQLGVLADPLDFAGFQKRRRDQEAAKLAKQKASAKDWKAKQKKADAARKAAEKRAKRAEARAEAAEKAAEKARREGKEALERAKRAEAMKHRRWATGARSFAQQSATAQDPNQSLALAMSALELAKNAVNPPRTGAEAVTSDMSSAAKSFVYDLVDSVNRVGTEPDFGSILQRAQMGDASAFEELGDLSFDAGDDDDYALYGSDMSAEEGVRAFMVAGAEESGEESEEESVGGPCCSSCAIGLGSCASPHTRQTPDPLVFGSSFTGFSGLFGGLTPVQGDDDDDPDDWGMF
jgi:hypothetical protein